MFSESRWPNPRLTKSVGRTSLAVLPNLASMSRAQCILSGRTGLAGSTLSFQRTAPSSASSTLSLSDLESILLHLRCVVEVRVMANAIPHTLFQWSLSCLQFIFSFLSFMSTLLSYYTSVFHSTLLSSPCVGTIQFLHKRAYIHRPYSVFRLSWYQRQFLAPLWLSSRLLVLWSTVSFLPPSTWP